ncbi:DNA-binding transcriptional regulator, MarR family [Paenibacillus catalpae]|uniref:DNA-binding transcriptional regulator, MarR family n=1 Tax=Paenibacillus catalpae TaxID=1045775 RepID=A0A1I2BCI0_9BACL|nr:MarR family transcriptional regulator [Paenibacillus catalpae]SFE53013.1 DNA-binding transcriptional regulator, MarR family [Paenibacillus catalpae]
MTHSAEKEILLNEMLVQVGLIQKKFQSEGEDEEKRWMMAQTKDPKAIQFLKETSTIMLHVIDAIGEMQPVNGIAISKHFGIPRGSISKLTRRLVEQEVINSENLPGNKKEVWFSLTPLGQSIYDLHKNLHAQIGQNVRKFLGRYSIEQMKFLLQCMKDTSQTSWVADETKERKEAPQETSAMSDMLALLQQLDDRKLKKAKELIQVAFFD